MGGLEGTDESRIFFSLSQDAEVRDYRKDSIDSVNLKLTKSDTEKTINCFWRSLRSCFDLFNKIIMAFRLRGINTAERELILKIGDVLMNVLLESNHPGVLKYAQDSLQLYSTIENPLVIQKKLDILLSFEKDFKAFSRFDGKSIGYSMALLVLLKALDKTRASTTIDKLIQSFNSRNSTHQKVIIQIFTLIVADKIGKDLELMNLLVFCISLLNSGCKDYKWNGNLYKLIVSILNRLIKGKCLCSVPELVSKVLNAFKNYNVQEGLTTIFLQMISKSDKHDCVFQDQLPQILQCRNGYTRILCAKALMSTGNISDLLQNIILIVENSEGIGKLNSAHGIFSVFKYSIMEAKTEEMDATILLKIKNSMTMFQEFWDRII